MSATEPSQPPAVQFKRIKSAQIPMKVISAHHRKLRDVNGTVMQCYKLLDIAQAREYEAREALLDHVAVLLGFKDKDEMRAFVGDKANKTSFEFNDETGDARLLQVIEPTPESVDQAFEAAAEVASNIATHP